MSLHEDQKKKKKKNKNKNKKPSSNVYGLYNLTVS